MGNAWVAHIRKIIGLILKVLITSNLIDSERHGFEFYITPVCSDYNSLKLVKEQAFIFSSVLHRVCHVKIAAVPLLLPRGWRCYQTLAPYSKMMLAHLHEDNAPFSSTNRKQWFPKTIQFFQKVFSANIHCAFFIRNNARLFGKESDLTQLRKLLLKWEKSKGFSAFDEIPFLGLHS